MCPFLFYVSWPLLSFAVACIAVLIGHAVAWGTNAGMSRAVLPGMQGVYDG